MPRSLTVFLVAVNLVAFSSLAADVIHLNNGEILVGEVIEQTRTTISIRTDEGATRTVLKESINRTSFNPAEDARARQILKEREEQKKRREEEARRQAEEARKVEEGRRRAEESSAAERARGRVSPRTASYYLVRSAVLPGYGHMVMDRQVQGRVYLALTGLALGYAISSRQAALAGQAEYERRVLEHTLLGIALGDADQGQRLLLGLYLNGTVFDQFQARVNRYNTSLLYLAGIYSLQLLHVAFDANSGGASLGHGRREGDEFRFSVAALPARGKPAVEAFASFSFRY